jgi:hypothetical protein
MSAQQSVRRGVAVISSGVVVVGAGAAVGALAADMSDEWSQQAALEAAAQVVADPVSDVTVPRPVVITRIEERHVTPKPVVVHRKVYIRVPARQGAPRPQAPRATSAPQRQPAAPAAKARPSRTVVAPAPAPAPAAPQASAPKATSKTS